jgi:hypothetical protein
MSTPQSKNRTCEPKKLQPPTFPLPQTPKFCWAHERMAPARIERCTWVSLKIVDGTVRPYYICTTCNNKTTSVLRDSGYPRGFSTWDDSIGIHPQNPRCHCGFPSRQDRKGRKARSCVRLFPDGFWVCASGACHYYSERKDGVSYADARKLDNPFDYFHPSLLEDVPRFC